MNKKNNYMDAGIQGALNQINLSYRAFTHNGKCLTKPQVIKILNYGLSKGYKLVSEISDEEINNLLITKPTI